MHPRLAVEAVALARTSTSPFDRYLEAPPDIHALWRTHGRVLIERANDLRAALEALVVDALVSLDADLAHRRIPLDDLRSAGWPDEPEWLEDC